MHTRELRKKIKLTRCEDADTHERKRREGALRREGERKDEEFEEKREAEVRI
jgi:hypothetical protein